MADIDIRGAVEKGVKDALANSEPIVANIVRKTISDGLQKGTSGTFKLGNLNIEVDQKQIQKQIEKIGKVKGINIDPIFNADSSKLFQNIVASRNHLEYSDFDDPKSQRAAEKKFLAMATVYKSRGLDLGEDISGTYDEYIRQQGSIGKTYRDFVGSLETAIQTYTSQLSDAQRQLRLMSDVAQTTNIQNLLPEYGFLTNLKTGRASRPYWGTISSIDPKPALEEPDIALYNAFYHSHTNSSYGAFSGDDIKLATKFKEKLINSYLLGTGQDITRFDFSQLTNSELTTLGDYISEQKDAFDSSDESRDSVYMRLYKEKGKELRQIALRDILQSFIRANSDADVEDYKDFATRAQKAIGQSFFKSLQGYEDLEQAFSKALTPLSNDYGLNLAETAGGAAEVVDDYVNAIVQEEALIAGLQEINKARPEGNKLDLDSVYKKYNIQTFNDYGPELLLSEHQSVSADVEEEISKKEKLVKTNNELAESEKKVAEVQAELKPQYHESDEERELREAEHETDEERVQREIDAISQDEIDAYDEELAIYNEERQELFDRLKALGKTDEDIENYDVYDNENLRFYVQKAEEEQREREGLLKELVDYYGYDRQDIDNLRKSGTSIESLEDLIREESAKQQEQAEQEYQESTDIQEEIANKERLVEVNEELAESEKQLNEAQESSGDQSVADIVKEETAVEETTAAIEEQISAEKELDQVQQGTTSEVAEIQQVTDAIQEETAAKKELANAQEQLADTDSNPPSGGGTPPSNAPTPPGGSSYRQIATYGKEGDFESLGFIKDIQTQDELIAKAQSSVERIKASIQEAVSQFGNADTSALTDLMNQLNVLDLTKLSDPMDVVSRYAEEAAISIGKAKQEQEEWTANFAKYKDLSASAAKLQLEVQNMDQGTADYTAAQNRLASMNQEMSDLANKLGTLPTDKLKEVDAAVQKVTDDYNKAMASAAGTDANKQTAATYTNLTKAAKEYYSLVYKRASNATSLTDKEIQKLEELEREYQAVANASASSIVDANGSVQSQTAAANAVQNFKNAMNLSSGQDFLTSEFHKAETALRSLEDRSEDFSQEFRTDIEQARLKFNDLLKSLNGVQDYNGLQALMKEVGDFQRSTHQLTKDANDFKLATDNARQKYMTNIQRTLEQNTAMSPALKRRYEELFRTFETAGGAPKTAIKNLALELQKLDTELYKSGRTGKSFGDTVKERLLGVNAQMFAQFFSFQDIIRYGRQIFSTIQQLDDSLVDLKKTSTMSTAELDEFYLSSNKVATSLGVTTQEVIQAAADWSRLGYSTKEAATQMAELSSQFAVISPGMSTEQAQEGLVSIMKAWDIATEDVERRIMDNVNLLGNRFAETNLDIVEGMKRSAATLSAIGTSTEDAFALFTGAQEVIQNAETVGTALKTLSLRIRGYDEETEEYSEDVVEATGKVADLTKTASSPGGISLFTDATQTEYKSLVDYLREISNVWDEIDAKSQTALLNNLFGKRGASVGSAILLNFDQIDSALKQMENAGGAADAEMEIVRESISYKLNALKQTWVGVAQDIANNKAIGGIIDTLTRLSNVISPLIKDMGLLGTAFTGFLTIRGFKQEGIVGKFWDAIDSRKAQKVFSKGLELIPSQSIIGVEAYRKEVQKLAGSIPNLSKDTVELADTFGKSDMSVEVFNQELEKTGKTTVSLRDKLKGFGRNLLSGIGSALAGYAISIAVNAIIQGIQNVINFADNKAQELQEKISKRDSDQAELEKLTEELESQQKELTELQNTTGILSTYDQERLESLKGSTKELERQVELAERQATISASEAAQAAVDAYNAKYTPIMSDEYMSALWSGQQQTPFAGQLMGLIPGINGNPVIGTWLATLLAQATGDQKFLDQIYQANVDAGAKTGAESSVLEKKLAEYQEALEVAAVAGEAIDAFSEYDDADLSGLKDSLEEAQGKAQDAKSELYSMSTSLQTMVATIESIPEASRTTEMNDRLADAKEMIDRIEKTIDPSGWRDSVFDKILGQDEFKKAKNNLIAITKASGKTRISLKLLRDTYPDLIEAVKKAGYEERELRDYLNRSIVDDANLENENKKLAQSYDTIVEKADEFIEKIDKLTSITSNQNYGSSISLSDFTSDEMKAIYSLIDGIDGYESMLQLVDGTLMLNSDLVKENTKKLVDNQIANNNAAKSSLYQTYVDNTKKIQEYTEAIKKSGQAWVEIDGQTISQFTIDKLYEANEAIVKQTDTLDLYNQKLREATGEYQNWIAAQNQASSGEMFDKTMDAFALIQDTFDTTSENYGKWGKGNYAYQAAIDLYLPDNIDHEDTEAIEAYMDSIDKYFLKKVDKDSGKVEYKGLDMKAFLDDAVAQGRMVIENGDYMIAGEQTMKQFAEGMGLSLPFVQAVFAQMDEYVNTFSWADEDYTDLFYDITDAYQTWQEALATGSGADEAKAHVEELAGQISRLSDEDKISLGFTDNAGEVLKDIDSIIAKMDELFNPKEVPTMEGLEELFGRYDKMFTRYRSDHLIREDEAEYLNGIKAQIQETAEVIAQLPAEKKIALGLDENATAETISQMAETEHYMGVISDRISEIADIDVKTDFSKVDLQLQEAAEHIASMDEDVQIHYGLEASTDPADILAQIKEGIKSDQEIEKEIVYSDNAQEAIGHIRNIKSALDAIPRNKNLTIQVTAADDVITQLNNITQAAQNATRAVQNANATPVVQKPSQKKQNGLVSLHGTANVNGTSWSSQTYGTAFVNGNAKLKGDWGLNVGQRVLIGELGPEIVVNPHTGKWQTYGDNGPEFAYIPSDAIVFNHLQTQDLLSHGHVNTRASALAKGTALASGNAMVTGGINVDDVAKITAAVQQALTGSSSSSSSSSPSGGGSSGGGSNAFDSASDSADEFAEKIDWIEVLISRLEREIENFDRIAQSSFASFSLRNKRLSNEIDTVAEEIGYQHQAYLRYMQEAESVGLDEGYAALVREGKIDIESITDEDLYNKIQEYQEWYEKALNALDTSYELDQKYKELYRDRFDLVQTSYQVVIDSLENENDILQAQIDKIEEKGYIISAQFYADMISNEEASLKQLYAQHGALVDKLNDAVSNGLIQQYSEEWYDMASEIQGVAKAIEDAEKNLVSWNNAIRQLKWDAFDTFSDKVKDIISESEFLQDVLDAYPLFNEKGETTQNGLATFGLIGASYNAYAEQAKEYALEILKINEDLAKDPNNQILIKRREELINAQREAIKGAEAEKDALKSLFKEGIEKQLSYMKELIDNYLDLIDRQREAYKYQREIAEQESEILRLEKQLAAYRGDNSEEGRLKRQQIQNSLKDARQDLADTQEEKRISEIKQMTSDLYDDYEAILNARLDNIDALVMAVIDGINANASIINDTIRNEATSVGYTLSESMNTIWNGSGGLIPTLSYYDARFDERFSNINGTLSQLSADEMAAVGGFMGSVGTQIDAINNMMVTTDGDVKEIDTSIDGVSSGISYLSAPLNGIASSIDANGHSLSSLIGSSSTSIVTAIANLKGTVDSWYAHAQTEYQKEAEKNAKNKAAVNSPVKSKAPESDVTVPKSNNSGNTTKPTANASPKLSVSTSGANISASMSNANGYSKIGFALWSNANGQDDLKWYYVNPSSGSASTTMSALNHTGGGKYTLHVYGYDKNGNPVFLAGSEFDVNAPAVTPKSSAPSGSTSSSGSNSSSSSSSAGKTTTQLGQYIKSNSNVGSSFVQKTTAVAKAQKQLEDDLKRLKKASGGGGLNLVKAYASGTSRVPKDDFFWTNDGAPETIVRKDGAVLTKLNVGDMVLNNKAHENLWDLVNSPNSFLRDAFSQNFSSGLTGISAANGGAVNVNVTFNLPNVKNYEEFMTQMRNDPKAEQMIQDITIGRLRGNGKLSKNNYIFS